MAGFGARWWVVAFAALCVAWHAMDVSDAWTKAKRSRTGADFASYHYAVQVAADGGDPYDKAQLGKAARADGTRKGVHPFFYPPPYLATMAWVRPLGLVDAYRTWFWLDEAFAVLCVVLLGLWWRELGTAVPVVLFAAMAAFTGWTDNHVMGQVNWPVLALALGGVWAASRDRGALVVLGGVLVGTACMMKMSPALFVAWWLLHRRWRPAAAAVATAVVWTLVSLPFVGPEGQWRFYTEVLPAFSSGRYNGLGVGIDLFGNHSIPNLWDTAFPAGKHHLILSDAARRGSQVSALALVGLIAFALRRAPADALGLALHVGTIGAAMLLIPVFTYEHHLVWLLPGVVAAVAACRAGRLGRAWWLPVAAGAAVWAYRLASMKMVYLSIRAEQPVAAFLLREAKFASIVVIGVACAVAAARRPAGEDG